MKKIQNCKTFYGSVSSFKLILMFIVYIFTVDFTFLSRVNIVRVF